MMGPSICDDRRGDPVGHHKRADNPADCCTFLGIGVTLLKQENDGSRQAKGDSQGDKRAEMFVKNQHTAQATQNERCTSAYNARADNIGIAVYGDSRVLRNKANQRKKSGVDNGGCVELWMKSCECQEKQGCDGTRNAGKNRQTEHRIGCAAVTNSAERIAERAGGICEKIPEHHFTPEITSIVLLDS